MKDITRDLGLGGGILAASITAALVTVWVTGIQQDRDHYRAAAAQPRPTATVTASPPAGVRRSPHPAPSSLAPSADRSVLAAGEPAHGTGGEPAAGSGGVSGSGSGSASPAPSPEPPASSSRRGVSVRLPLGVLPDVDLTIGGNR